MCSNRVCQSIDRLYADAERAREVNFANLSEILSANADTLIGKKYSFSSLRGEKNFAHAVAMSEYSAYSQPISRIYAGAEDVLIHERPHCFLYTSGSMGKRKIFPLTLTALSRYSSYICDMPFYLTGTRGGTSLHTSVFVPSDERGGKLLSSAYFGYLKDFGLTEGRYVGGNEFNFSPYIKNVPYVKLRLALAEEDLVSVQSIFHYDTLLTFGYLESNWQTILRDMRDGTVSTDLPKGLAEKLIAASRADGERLRTLEKILDGGFSSPVVPRIWPRLRFVSGIGDDSSWQTAALKKYTGDIPLGYFTYTSSEVMAGVVTGMDKSEYLLLPRSAYYEFLPEGSDRTIPLGEIQAGERYELVVTTFSGLYRYKMGDVIKVTGFRGQAPTFRVCGRVGQQLNIAGEKIDAATLSETVRILQGKGTDVYDFTVTVLPCSSPGRYVFFMEAEGDEAQLASSVDDILCKLSADYAELRSLGMIEKPLVCLLNRFAIDTVLHSEGPSHKKSNVISVGAAYDKLKRYYDANNREDKTHK